MNELIPIQDVTIVLTYPDDTTEQFTLQAPNGQDPFRAGFRRYNILPDFRNGQLSWQRGNRKYQLVAEYDYASHSMDIRKLLVAKSIQLRFPPNFSLTEEYQSAEVLLAGSSAAKNYLAGFAAGTDQARDAMPSGGVTLEFEGVEAFTEAQMMDYHWYQPVTGTPFTIRHHDYDVASIGTSGTSIIVAADADVRITQGNYTMTDRMGTMASSPTFTLRYEIRKAAEVEYTDEKVVDNGCDNTDDTLQGSTQQEVRNNFAEQNETLSIEAERATGGVTQACGGDPRDIDCTTRGFIIGDAEIGDYDTEKMTITLG